MRSIDAESEQSDMTLHADEREGAVDYEGLAS
jgi:hypothetical protein